MKLGSIALLLVLSSTAYAQAPGEVEIAPPGMTPEVAPTPTVEAPRRWSVGLGIGFVDLAPHSAPEATTQFDVGQLAVRYRATRHLEVELALAGGGEVLDTGEAGYRSLSQAVLGLRWRFRPEQRWNWWVMAGMGSLAVTRDQATQSEQENASQSTLQFGLGLERRWTQFALQAELRAVGVAPNDDAPMTTPPALPGGMDAWSRSLHDPREGKAGGQFSISANYYF